MKNHWAKEFYDLAKSNGLNCKLVTLMNGWFETLLLEGKLCFTKSFTYNTSRRQYFQGVDPEKLDKNGDLVLLCGGITGSLRDIFIIPWDKFFATLRRGESINTYRPPKEYFQYKFYIRDRDSRWVISVQGGDRPTLDVTGWRYNVDEALRFFK